MRKIAVLIAAWLYSTYLYIYCLRIDVETKKLVKTIHHCVVLPEIDQASVRNGTHQYQLQRHYQEAL